MINDDQRPLKIIHFGRAYPPFGGVAASVSSIHRATVGAGHSCELLSWRALRRRWDIAHVHFCRPWKMLAGVVVGRLIGRKVFVTVHAGVFDLRHLANRISTRLSDGLVLLNQELNRQLVSQDPTLRTIVTTSICEEALTESPLGQKPQFERIPGRKYVLVYAYDDSKIDGRATYGYDFLFDNIDALGPRFQIVLLDLQSKVPNSEIPSGVIHLRGPHNFPYLLRQIDIYLRPTLSDGASVSVFEALKLGIPVVASDVVDRHGDVILYKAGDVAALAQALERAIDYKPKFTGLDSVQALLEFYRSNL